MKVALVFLETGGDPAEMLEFGKTAFNPVPLFVGVGA
jgi:hypothetical protein